MGNRAAIAFTDRDDAKPQTVVYMHWNGGPESVYAILDVMKEHKGFVHSASYSTARFCHLACELVGHDGHSVGIDCYCTPMSHANSADDNGLYIVNITTGDVTRYVTRGYGQKPHKLTVAETATEERMARKHRYWENDDIRNGLREHFKEKQPA